MLDLPCPNCPALCFPFMCPNTKIPPDLMAARNFVSLLQAPAPTVQQLSFLMQLDLQRFVHDSETALHQVEERRSTAGGGGEAGEAE